MELSPEAIAQAKLALKNFRAMQPTLTQYAKMLTGRPDARVVASETSNGSTDGKSIYYRPPISLGKQIPHQPWSCDKRDEYQIMRCPACAQREDVLVTIYHEIAHIWFDSFAAVTPAMKKKAIKDAIERLGTKYGVEIQKRLAAHHGTLGYMGLASLVSPFMPILVNALEDARVNRELFRAMPGTKTMFDANTGKVFRDGVEQIAADGMTWEHQLWRERPLNMQVLIGIFCMASGYKFDDWLDPFVVTSLSDDTVRALVAELDDANDAEAIFRQAFPILARLRELGFCRDPEKDPEDDFVPPYDEPEDEPEEEPDDDAAATDEPSGDADDSSGDESGDDADSDSESDAVDQSNGQTDASDDPDESDDADGEEGTGGGDDSEGDDDSDSADESGAGDGDDEPAEAEEVDDEARGDSSDGCSGGPEEDGEGPGEPSGDADADAGDPGDERSRGAEDEVSEEDGAGGEPPVDSGTEGSPDLRDGDQPGGDDLVGSDGADRGDEGEGEPGDGVDPDGVGTDGLDDAGQPASNGGAGVDDSDDMIDRGADNKSIRVDGEPKRPTKPDIDWGAAEDVEIAVHEIGDHEAPDSVHMHDDDDTPHSHRDDEDTEGDAVVKAVMVAGVYFDMPSANVTGVNINSEASGYYGSMHSRMSERGRRRLGMVEDIAPPDSVVNPAVSKARIVFAANYRGRNETGLKRGRVHSPHLGMKAPVNDPTMFRQRRLPGREDYFVGIGLDISYSTVGVNIDLIKRVALAEAEMLNKLGIPFFMYGHTGIRNRNDYDTMSLEMVVIKEADELFDDKIRERLVKVGPNSANLDGHTLEFYRKLLDKQRATKRILHYYTDGEMPCENHDEELEILKKEILAYRKSGYILRCVGVRTDSPRQHGLPTVLVNEQADVLAVVNDLEQALTGR